MKAAFFQDASWLSHKSKGPVKVVSAIYILSWAGAIHEAKTTSSAYCEISNTVIRVRTAVDSKDLFTFFSTKRNSTHRTISEGVDSIRLESQTGNRSQTIGTLGRLNLADMLTKRNPID